jgi:hypothetical protein
MMNPSMTLKNCASFYCLGAGAFSTSWIRDWPEQKEMTQFREVPKYFVPRCLSNLPAAISLLEDDSPAPVGGVLLLGAAAL